MATYTAKCPTCNEEVRSEFSQAQANRNLGLHRRKAHGYQSPEYEEAKQYRLNVKRRLLQGGQAVAQLEKKAKLIKGTAAFREMQLRQLDEARKARWSKHRTTKKVAPSSTGNIEQRREYQRLWRENRNKLLAKAKAQENPIAPTPDAAVPCKLSECPQCGSRFYVVRGQQSG